MAAYTNHIGRSARDRGKDTTIRTASNLADAERHNNHDYTQADVDRMESDINLNLRYLNRHYVLDERGDLVELEGKLDLYDRVKSIYEREFTQSVSEYNQRQRTAGHSERQIEDYFEEISQNEKQEIAVEGLIQIGSYEEEWSKLAFEYKLRMAPILLKMLEETLKELNKGNSRFVLAGASLHLNEGSPHIHYVGVPIHESPTVKKGLTKRVKKSAVFTKETLGEGLQDRVRAKIAPLVAAEFGWEFDEKKTGRNEDLSRNTIANEKLKEQIRKNNEELERQEALKRAQEAELSVLEEKIAQSRLEASEASQRAHEAEQRLLFAEREIEETEKYAFLLEEHVKTLDQAIQTPEEYQIEADELEEAALHTRDAALEMEEMISLVAPWNKKKAQDLFDKWALKIRDFVMPIFEKLRNRLFVFEEAEVMQPQERRVRKIDSIIADARARVQDRSERPEDHQR